MEGPDNSNLTMSTLPDQAAKCSGDEPLLSTMLGEASCSKRSFTISLKQSFNTDKSFTYQNIVEI